jgi:hypothetical protein
MGQPAREVAERNQKSKIKSQKSKMKDGPTLSSGGCPLPHF